MNEIPLKQIIEASLENLKKVISTDNIVGDPIRVDDDTVIIPVNKVSVGFTSGGVDFDGKNNKSGQPHFGGGNGAGMTMTPLSFLVISEGNVRLLNINDPQSNNDISNIIGSVSELVERSPAILSKLMKTFKKEKKQNIDED